MSILWCQIGYQELDGKKSTADVSEVVFYPSKQQWDAGNCPN